jgi:hypothetical protein
MTCPSCGRIAGAGLERCPTCNSILAVPTDRPATPTPIVRAPTNRGEMAQRALGIFAPSLVPPRPQSDPGGQPVAGLAPAPPPPGAGPAGGVAPAPPPARHLDPASTAARTPPDPQGPGVPPAGASGWATHSPAPATYAAGTGDVTGATVARPAVDATAVLSAPAGPGGRDRLPATDAVRAADEPTEERPRAVRPNVEAPWPPPPGPWSGRRTSES